MKLPVKYSETPWQERKYVRRAYVEQQEGKCYYCDGSFSETPPKSITDKPIDWSLFPKGFLKHPIHLHHCHDSDLTIGAVHAYCNAVLWEYEGE